MCSQDVFRGPSWIAFRQLGSQDLGITVAISDEAEESSSLAKQQQRTLSEFYS